VDSKIVERLKDKKRHEYEDDLRKLDQKNLDDLTTVRIAKRIQKAEKDK
jgi:flagellar biosynthesis chaperone FliJ